MCVQSKELPFWLIRGPATAATTAEAWLMLQYLSFQPEWCWIFFLKARNRFSLNGISRSSERRWRCKKNIFYWKSLEFVFCCSTSEKIFRPKSKSDELNSNNDINNNNCNTIINNYYTSASINTPSTAITTTTAAAPTTHSKISFFSSWTSHS